MSTLQNALTFEPTLVRQTDPSSFSAVEVCAEALAAFRAGWVNGTVPESSVWSIHAQESQKGLLRILETGTADQLSHFMANIHERPVLRGYDQHALITRGLDNDAKRNKLHRSLLFVALSRLAAGLGTVRHFKPQQPDNFEYTSEDQINDMVLGIAEALGLKGSLPTSGIGAIGLETPLGLLSYRHIFALGYLREIRNVLQSRSYDQIVEIGGGLGRVGFHIARDLGLPLTIIDLPVVGVTQFHFLRGNGITTSMWTDDLPQSGEARLVNAFADFDPDQFKNALFVNFDSLVEMGRSTQDAYFNLIKDAGGDLLSVNHECQKTMTREGHLQNWDLVRFEEWGYRAGPRHMFWERDGWVSRLFRRS